jgi:hypothetical protein
MEFKARSVTGETVADASGAAGAAVAAGVVERSSGEGTQ